MTKMQPVERLKLFAFSTRKRKQKTKKLEPDIRLWNKGQAFLQSFN